MKKFISDVLDNMPNDWVNLTTHRLDIYNEDLAKVEFLDGFKKIKNSDTDLKNSLKNLPTAFDYIRLGHPLSCILEWVIATNESIDLDNVITFSSKTMPILAILRKNLHLKKKTQILFKDELPTCFDIETLKEVYGYEFDLKQINESLEVSPFDGSTILLTTFGKDNSFNLNENVDFIINIHPEYGSIVLVDTNDTKTYINEIQHVRRRESIAMTPTDCLAILKEFVGRSPLSDNKIIHKESVLRTIKEITHSQSQASLGSCGLSIQYAITMGLVHEALINHKGKDIKLIVPPNCYGGTNDQARRAAACVANMEVMDLPVDGGTDMVASVEKVLDKVAKLDAIPFIIAEIPTNPRVEVPVLEKLEQALSKKRLTPKGEEAISPVFILDQTFCPNYKFLGDDDILSSVKTISYVSGSKFPSGGLCTAGYCVANKKADSLMSYIDKHLVLCDNIANDFQISILEKQMPSMIKRIDEAYINTRKFVDHIEKTLPSAKINFVSEQLAQEGYTPSVFSLDLPTKGDTEQERENYKRELNHKLIRRMINEIPEQSKHCVSYGQLKGCYWTIPATSTQGTTKEDDKDYIVRVAIAPEFDLENHKRVFSKFCKEEIY